MVALTMQNEKLGLEKGSYKPWILEWLSRPKISKQESD